MIRTPSGIPKLQIAHVFTHIITDHNLLHVTHLSVTSWGGSTFSPFPNGLHHLHEAFRKAHLVIAAEVAAEEGHRGARLPSASRAANAVHVVLDGVGHMVVHHLEKCGTSPRPRQKNTIPIAGGQYVLQKREKNDLPKSKSPLGMVYGWIYRTDYNLLRKPNWGRIDVWC